jgi:hypothetical protein
MNDNKNKYPIGELPQSASSSSKTVDELAEKKKNQKKSLIKMGAMGILTLILLIFSSLSWFTMNRDVSGSGMGIKSAGSPFELAVTGDNEGAKSYIQTGKGDAATYDEGTLLNDMEGGIEVPNGTSGSYSYIDDTENRTTSTGSFYTTGNADTIKWRLSSEYDATDDGVGPASCGEFTFYVIPKRTGSLEVTFSLKLDGYSADVKENDNETFNVSSLSLIESNDVAYESVTYLNSHILFFTGRTGSGTSANPYIYTGLVDKDEFSMTFSNCTEDVLEPVTLYWVWANTFADMTCIAQNTSLATDSVTISDLRDYVLSDPVSVLKGIGSEEAVGYMTASEEFDESTAENNITALSYGYNKADQSIGSNIAYFLLVLNAK